MRINMAYFANSKLCYRDMCYKARAAEIPIIETRKNQRPAANMAAILIYEAAILICTALNIEAGFPHV